MRRTKIVCTLGPASSSEETIGALLDAGLNAVRLNFSHGSHEEHAATLERVSGAALQRDRMVPVIADLQGPKIRTGGLVGGEPVELETGSALRLTPDDVAGTPQRITVDYPKLAAQITPGQRILISDGALEIKVVRVEDGDVLTEVVSGGILRERQGVNLPEAKLDIPSVTDKDEADLRFAIQRGVDYIALSFVRRPLDLQIARELIRRAGGQTPLIAKIEKPEALDHLAEILECCDGVMVARGDLGVELSPWQVPIEQKRIIEEAGRMRKPVITATQMLESMIHSSSPTRAEASDVANAVFDGSDALMLSGETAVGKHPVRAVEVMAKIIEAAEANLRDRDYVPAAVRAVGDDLSDAVASSAARLAANVGAKYIVVYTETGYTARLVSKHRPRALIMGLSRNEEVCRQMKLLWGVRAKTITPVDDLNELIASVDRMILELGWVEKGALIAIVAGTPFKVGGKTNLIQLHRVGVPG